MVRICSAYLRVRGLRATLSPCKTTDFSSPVKRPAYSVLSKAKLRELGSSIPSWKDALSR